MTPLRHLLKGAGRFPAASSSRRWVGLDLGSQSIKLAECEETPAGPRLLKTLIQELPLAQGEKPIDRVGWLQTALKEFTARDVHASISGPQVVIRRVTIPMMSKGEIPEAIKWEMRDYLSFPIQDAVLDFVVIGEVWDKDVKKQDVLVAAVPKPLMAELVATIERSGARVASLLPTQLAVWRCLMAGIPETRHGSVAVITLGSLKTEVTIVKDGQVRLIRDIGVGSASMTEALIGTVAADAGQITIDHSRAEALKRRYGVLGDVPEGTTEDGVPLFHLASLMRPVLENLLTEVSRLFDFYRVQIEEAGISRVFLCGAGANLKQLQPFLAEGLGMTVEVFNPLIRMPERSQPAEPEQIAENGPRLAVAMGLALEHGEGMNLLPNEGRRTQASALSTRGWVVAAKRFAAAALAIYAGLHLTALIFAQQIRSRQRAWAEIEPAYTDAMSLISTRQALDHTMQQVQQFLDRQPVWEGLLKEMSRLVPPTIELEELGVEAGRFQVKGLILSDANAGEGGLGRFVEALDRSIFFDRVELTSSQMRSGDTGTMRFTIEGRLR